MSQDLKILPKITYYNLTDKIDPTESDIIYDSSVDNMDKTEIEIIYDSSMDKMETTEIKINSDHLQTIQKDKMFELDEKEKSLPCLDTSQKDNCLLYTSPSPRDRQKSRMPSSA